MKDYSYTNYRRRRKKRPFGTYEIITAVSALLTICCAYSGSIDPQRFFLAPFLTLAFMPMLIITLLLVLIGLFFRRWLNLLIALVMMFAVLPIGKLFVPLNSSDEAPPIPADPALILKVMTYNVLAFNYNEPQLSGQPSETMHLILEANPDVVLLQEGSAGGVGWDEMPSLKPYLGEMNQKYPYRYYGTEGLNIMSKYPFTTQPVGEVQYARSPLGYNRDQTSYLARAYDLQLPNGKQLRLIDFRLQSYHLSFGKSSSIRVSPDVKPSSLERMRRSFALRNENAVALRKAIDESPGNLIVCGDMNDVTMSHVYRTIRGNDLHDAWGDAGTGYAHTYNRHNLPYRIDHMLYRGEICPFDAQRIKGGSSDHYPLMIAFDIDYNSSNTINNN